MKARRVGSDLSHKDLLPGMRLVAPRKGTMYLIVRVQPTKILARFRRGKVGRWSAKLHEIVPSEVLGFRIET